MPFFDSLQFFRFSVSKPVNLQNPSDYNSLKMSMLIFVVVIDAHIQLLVDLNPNFDCNISLQNAKQYHMLSFWNDKKKRNCLWWPGDGYAFDWIDYIGTYFLNNLSTVQLRKNNAMRMRWTKMLQTNLYAKHFAVFFPDFCRYCCQYSVRPRPTFDCLLLFRWMNWKFLFRFGFDAKNHQHLP